MAAIGRRRVTGFVVVSVATWPLALRAQQQALPVIGLLLYGSRGVGPDRVRSFRQDLAEAGGAPLLKGGHALHKILRSLSREGPHLAAAG